LQKQPTGKDASMASRVEQFDVVVVGAGFAGMYMLHTLRSMGVSARCFEAGDDVGGTWYWNRYPGARCDVESVDYSYQFCEQLQQEWNWTERYAGQPEILAYANHVADRFELRRDIQFNCRITSAHYDETRARWQIATSRGDTFEAQFCIFATGCLSITNTPDLQGLEHFQGEVYHTGEWPHHDVDFSGKRVAVIGTGSSGIQAIPQIARQAEQLSVYQRSPTYSVPAHNHPMDPAFQNYIKANYADYRARNQAQATTFGARYPGSDVWAGEMTAREQNNQLENFWNIGGLFFTRIFGDLMITPETNQLAQDFVREKIREKIDDPAVAELLCPSSTIGCKRLCSDTEYFETYNLPHVSLVDANTHPIEQITATGISTPQGEACFDIIVFATGFDAMTGAMNRIDIRGRQGQRLKDKWADGPKTMLGVQTAGFPNLFLITGPGSPSVLSNMIQSIEQHVEWIAQLLQWMKDQHKTTVESEIAAEEEWMAHVANIMGQTLYNSCNSWYRGANIEGKPKVFMALADYPSYVAHCNSVAHEGYPGFSIK
jgi:cation diffusion facilitator CzcD-associated flavoprotein CzcO